MEASGIIQAKISSLINSESNPRKIDREALERLILSVREFPSMLAKRPLVCVTHSEGKFMVLGGNMRLKACKKAGLKIVPIIIADEWSDEERRQFVIKDNISYGEWDYQSLESDWDVSELKDWGMQEFDEEDQSELEKSGQDEFIAAVDDVSLPQDTNMIAIALSELEYSSWLAIKTKLNTKNDKKALLEIIKNFENENNIV